MVMKKIYYIAAHSPSCSFTACDGVDLRIGVETDLNKIPLPE